MRIRIYKFIIVILICTVAFLTWTTIKNYRQTVTAFFVSNHCENAEKTASAARETTDVAQLDHEIEFLICYYQGCKRSLSDSHLSRIVRRDYEHTLTNALIAYDRISTNNMRSQIEMWEKKYAH